MSADEDQGDPPEQFVTEPSAPKQRTKAPRLRAEDKSALSWLARWLGIPFVIVIALYYAEPFFRADPTIEIVPTVTRQRVQPYPFPEGATGPTLAPPEVPRQPRPEPLPMPNIPLPDLNKPATEIVAHPISQPQPQYPRRALEAGKEGVVRLRVTIAPDGTVAKAEIVSAQPRGWFDSAAVNAVMQWRYQPPGRMIQTEVEIEFKLK
jgi:TonB family protein